MIKIDNDTAAKLAQYASLTRMLNNQMEAFGNVNDLENVYKEFNALQNELVEEFNALQNELVEEFMPLVRLLADAGLIGVAVEGIDLSDKRAELTDGKRIDSACWDVSKVYENGNITLHAAGEWHTGWNSKGGK